MIEIFYSVSGVRARHPTEYPSQCTQGDFIVPCKAYDLTFGYVRLVERVCTYGASLRATGVTSEWTREGLPRYPQILH